jgi:hypothetical protein
VSALRPGILVPSLNKPLPRRARTCEERERRERERDGGIDEAPGAGGAGEGGSGRGAVGGANVPMLRRGHGRLAARRAGARLLLGHIPVRRPLPAARDPPV